MNETPDDRSAMALAFGWVSRITTISLMMVVPGVGGYLLDQRLHTRVVFTLLGFGLGMAIGMWQLIAATRTKMNDRQAKGD